MVIAVWSQVPLTLGILVMLILLPNRILPGEISPTRLVDGHSDRNAFVKTSVMVNRHHNIFLETFEETTTRTSARSLLLQQIRGGGTSADDDEDDNEEEEEDNEEDEGDDDAGADGFKKVETTSSAGDLLDISQQVLLTITRLTKKTTMAVTRAFQAVFEHDDQKKDNVPFTSRIWNTLQRMYKAALSKSTETQTTFSEKEATVIESVTPKATAADVATAAADKMQKFQPSDAVRLPNSRSDFGSYLAQAYGVVDTRHDGGTKGSAVPFLGGTLADALRIARSQARLLVVFIPSSQPPKHSGSTQTTTTTTTTPDQEAIQGLLSPKVVSMARKRARKDETHRSFIFWGAKAGSPDAITALKRLKVKQVSSKGGKKPVLLVAYPKQVLSSVGEPYVIPIALAQHHCNPPPPTESMAAWLNAIRKRHAKEYATMQVDLLEARLFQERQEGYRESITVDSQRQEMERKIKAERIAREKAEQERIQAIEQRRKELRSSLPAEPTSANAVTIALRFIDGRTGQRKFEPDTPLEVVFNWVDALYDMERETVKLATMNGQKTFSWQDCGTQTLAEAGIGRMTGLRVSQINSDGGPATPQPESSTS